MDMVRVTEICIQKKVKKNFSSFGLFFLLFCVALSHHTDSARTSISSSSISRRRRIYLISVAILIVAAHAYVCYVSVCLWNGHDVIPLIVEVKWRNLFIQFRTHTFMY